MARKSTAEAIGNRRKQRPAPQQMDLFAARITGGAPDWPDLPEEAREAVGSLMTRLILEHAGATATPTTKLESDHDQ